MPYENYPICPYCEYRSEEQEHLFQGDESIVIDCPSCEKKYKSSMHIEYINKKDCSLNNEQHDFVMEDALFAMRVRYICKECGHFK